MDGAQQAPRLPQVLDEKVQAMFVTWFKTLPSDGTIRLFQRSAARQYYSCHGPDAELLRTWYLQFGIEVVSIGTTEKLPSASFSQQVFEEMITDLLVHRGKRVELWAQDNDKKSAWHCIKKGSPGNMQQFEDIVSTEALNDTPVVAAVIFSQEGGRIKFGCSYCNPALRTLGVSEFLDSEQFLNLETFLIQVGAKECLVPQPGKDFISEGQQIVDILQRANVVLTELKKQDFVSKDIQNDLGQLLADNTNIISELEMKLAMQSLGSLIKFLDLLNDETNIQQFKLKREDLKRFMRMDTAVINALNVFPLDQHTSNRSASSLFGLLNRCQTVMAQRELKQWLAQPLMQTDEIRKRQDLVEIFMDDVLFCSSMRDDVLKQVPDLDAILRKMQKKKAKLEDAVSLGRFLRCMPQLVEALNHYTGAHKELMQKEFVEPLQEIASYFENLTCLIDNTLEITPNEVLIQPSFDDALETLAEQKRKVEYEINKEYKRMLRDLDVTDKVCKVDRNAQQGFFWKINRAKSNELNDLAAKSYEVILTNKGGTYFTNKEMKRLNQDYSNLLKAYQTRQTDLEHKFLETVASYAPVIEDVKYYLTCLDLFTCFATVALDAPVPYVRPLVLGLDEGRKFMIQGGRHAMLERQEGVTFIPNDYNMDADHNMFIITGPNMGGKSTYIRTAGLIQLMAQIGMPVPCTSATLSVCDSLLARIGATDYQVRGVSTFMAEMLETSTILGNASEHSLIIVDELGRGTSTYDGYGLAWAICEAIACEVGAFCLFATHFHELTRMSIEHSNVCNLHVTADTSHDTITMLYQVQNGPCEKSFGIHVAELAKFPQSIVKCAKRKAAELEDFTVAQGRHKSAKQDAEVTCSKSRVDSLFRDFVAISAQELNVNELRCKLEEYVNNDAYIRAVILEST